jgi:DNA-binding response OmpR family regulator
MDSMASGADDYIVKSESMPGDVVAKVHAALENHKG